MTDPVRVSEAMEAWGLSGQARLISHRENAVYEVYLPDGARAALRLHRPGYNTIAEIQSELWWTHALVDEGFPAPGPVARADGLYLTELSDGQVATLISWVEGQPTGMSGAPLPGSPHDQIARFTEVGRLLARLHIVSDGLNPHADFQRRDWNIDGLLGDEPLWGRFWEHPGLDPDTRTLVDTARAEASADLEAYHRQGGKTGLIHADALRENVFTTENGLVLIDFDDSGFGFRMFDLAVAVSQSLEDDNYDDLCAAVLAGYQSLRPLGAEDIRMLPLFALCRTFASLGWIVPRLPLDEASHARFIRRAALQSKRFLGL